MSSGSPKPDCTSQCGATGPRYTTRTLPTGSTGSSFHLFEFGGHGASRLGCPGSRAVRWPLSVPARGPSPASVVGQLPF